MREVIYPSQNLPTPESGSTQQELGYFNPVRFIALCERTGATADVDKMLSVYNRIKGEHRMPPRQFHTESYVNDELNYLYLSSHLAQDVEGIDMAGFNLVEYAAWTHKAVYKIGAWAENNEENSAILAKELLHALGFPEEVGEEVGGLILATKHDSAVADPNAMLLCDAGLAAGFVSEEDEYHKTVEKIRWEHPWLSEQKFAAGMLEFYDTLLASRGSIFHTQYFQEKYEEQARHNIAQSQERLRRITATRAA